MKTEVLVAVVGAGGVAIGGLIGSLSTLVVTWLIDTSMIVGICSN